MSRKYYSSLVAVLLLVGTVDTHIASAGWYQEQKLTAEADASPEDSFGAAAAISGDYAIVGAKKSAGNSAGSAYAFRRTASGWVREQRLVAPSPSNGRFGSAVSISGDYAIISGFTLNLDHMAYLYERDASGWHEVETLSRTDSFFGEAVAISGNRAVVSGGVLGGGFGSAYVYERDAGGNWALGAVLTPDAPVSGDEFGRMVWISGDDVIVGTNYGNAAYIFHNDGGTWTQSAHLVASDAASGDRFGSRVVINGDYAVVGASGAGEGDSGAAYVFQRSGPTWTEVDILRPDDPSTDKYFGSAVSLDGERIVVGAYGDDHAGGWATGSAYVFELGGSDWVQIDKLVAEDAAASDNFGTVSISGDVVIVGAPYQSEMGIRAGAAYIFTVPEPATMSLLALGGMAVLRRRRK